MVLVDTSVWIRHLREGDTTLQRFLNDGKVVSHPFVVGELACGTMKNREEILSLLLALPMSPRLEDDEILTFIDSHGLMGNGLGLVDVHLLASTRLSGLSLWTRDKKLAVAASKLNLLHIGR